jgi:uncharacterized pyridoxal phosphate-dependent enzyme
MTNYEDLGVRRIINACATLTKLGGSLMPPEVVRAMNDAAGSFIDLHDLHRRVGDRIAEITGNDGLKDEIIVHKTHRNGYDYAVRQVGAKIVEIGSTDGTTREDLEQAISDKTAAFFWFQGAMCTPGDLPLSEVIEIANRHGVPVVVDAAAQLPPVSNLWAFTQMGAALAVFSGGKDLRGPQSSGLVLGRRDLVEACRAHGSPNQAVGRPMKVGKEEMMGLLAAVERYLTLDHDGRAQSNEATVTLWSEALNAIPGLKAERTFPNEAGQPLPRCLVTVDAAQAGITRDEVVHQLAIGTPGIIVDAPGENGIHLNPMTLEPGEAEIVLARLVEIMAGAAK